MKLVNKMDGDASLSTITAIIAAIFVLGVVTLVSITYFTQ